MQFEMNQKIGSKQEVTFTGQLYRFKPSVTKALVGAFEKLGGQVDHEINSCKYFFPSFITAQVIQEVIRNTCFECGGLMKDGVAFDNTWISSDDFGNDAGQRGTTMSKIGPAKQIKVRKCTVCGHSHT